VKTISHLILVKNSFSTGNFNSWS